MTVDRDSAGRIFYEYLRADSDARTLGRKSIVRLAPEDVFHIPGLGFDGLVGYSPIAMAKQAIGMGLACDEYGAAFYQNGAQPGGVLEHPAVSKTPSAVRDSWNAIYQGSRNAPPHRCAGGGHDLQAHLHFAGAGAIPRNAQVSDRRDRAHFPRAAAHGWATSTRAAFRTSSTNRWNL